MAVNLKEFKKTVERRLPILFLIDESGNGATLTEKKIVFNPEVWHEEIKYYEKERVIHSMDYVATIMEKVLMGCVDKNIRAEISVISYGEEWQFRYPYLGEDEAPYFELIEKLDITNLCNEIRRIPKSKQAVLGSALDLCKAILEDDETVKSDRYKPIVIVLSTKNPSAGWQNHLEELVNNGRSAMCQFFWVNVGTDVALNSNNIISMSCNLDGGVYHIISSKNKSAGENMLDNEPKARLATQKMFSNEVTEVDGCWGESFTYLQIERNGYKGFADEKECRSIAKNAQKQLMLGHEYTITNALGKQFCSIKQTDGDKYNKKSLDTLFIDKRHCKFNGGSIASSIVNEIKFEPICEEKQPEEMNRKTFEIPDLEGDFGDGSDAKGDGTV